MNSRVNNKKTYKYLFWVWLITVIVISSIPNIISSGFEKSLNDRFFLRLDYLAHFVLFLFLTMFFYLTPMFAKKKFYLFYCLLFFLVSVVLAFVMEYYQTYIPGRTFNHIDLFFNGLGSMTGIATSYLLFRSRLRKKKITN